MSRLLLDTSAYSAFFKGDPAAVEAIRSADALYLNPVVLGELFVGFGRGKRRDRNERELEQFLSSGRVQILDINEETASRYAVILESLRSAGTPIPTNDLWISANAMQHGLDVLTADAHYSRVSQIVVRSLAPIH